jgi:hypothetical protein
LRYASNDTTVAGYALRDASRLEADDETDVRVAWGSKRAIPASLVGEEVVLVFELAGAAVLLLSGLAVVNWHTPHCPPTHIVSNNLSAKPHQTG